MADGVISTATPLQLQAYLSPIVYSTVLVLVYHLQSLTKSYNTGNCA